MSAARIAPAGPPDGPILSVRNLHLAVAGRHRDTPILRDVSLDIIPGEVHGLVGESGAGKTMIGKVILGIQPSRAVITGGSVRFDGRDITHLQERERRSLMGRGLGLIPQDPMTSLNPAYRIGGQVADVLRLHLGMDRAAARARALELLDDVHIREPERVLRQYPHELSGGMRQRVLIAIAFACRPKLIVADEPTTALDVTVQRQVLALIKEMQAQEGASILFVTHDLGVVAKICDRVTVLHGGRVLEAGDTRRIVERPQHDYTKALMAATPRHDRPGDLLRPVPEALTARLNEEALAYDAAPGAMGAGRG
ncbi:MAG: ABC transporter ATP-binding protein [Rhodospirillaceae bacterium]|nr:ABC transporter ATP-binding protein [Rhodospirillaceae bacterium]